MISEFLLEVLACPVDKAPVVLAADEQSLICQACNRAYPIRDGIPVMLVDEAIELT